MSLFTFYEDICVHLHVNLQPSDWLAVFHLELLQAILFTAVKLSAAVFLLLSIAVEVFQQPSFRILLLQG